MFGTSINACYDCSIVDKFTYQMSYVTGLSSLQMILLKLSNNAKMAPTSFAFSVKQISK